MSLRHSEKLYTCPRLCGWYRNVVVFPASQERYEHSNYGPVTYMEAAQKDIATHNCEEHKAAMRKADRVKELVYA